MFFLCMRLSIRVGEMDSTNKKMLEILVGMVRLELKSPGKINDNDLDVLVDMEMFLNLV